MLTLTTSIDEIDALIKNMEYLSPQQSERIRISKLDELKTIMNNKPLLELINDITGNDWHDDTQRVIKKIENKYKIQQFTDIYINSLRCLLIYKTMNDVTSSCNLELTKEFGQWIFNARYQGENHVVKWFDIKVNKYFSKTDLPKKFMDIMGGNNSYHINKEWILKNQDFFFNQSIFNDYHVLLAEFLEKLAKEEKTPELEVAKNIPEESYEASDGVPTEEKKESIVIQNTISEKKSPSSLSAIAQVNTDFKKKMIQVGVDIAGDPIMQEVSDVPEITKTKIDNVEQVKINEEVNIIKEENIQLEIQNLEKTVVSAEVESVEKVSIVALDNLSNSLDREPLPWEDDWRVEKVELPKSDPPPVKFELPQVEPKKIEKTFSKPGSSFSKPGSGFNKPGSGFSKPGSHILIASYDDGYDDIKETPDSYTKNNQDDSLNTVKESFDLFDESIVPVYKKPSINNISENSDTLNVLEEANIDVVEDFEDLVEEKNKVNASLEEIVEETVFIGDKLFENGMTNNTEKEMELKKQKEEDIKKLEETIRMREIEDKERLERNGLAKNKAFMSLKKKSNVIIEDESK